MLSGNDVRQKYIDFFVKRGHVQIPSAPLVPENDPTTLFTGSGMQPMITYLLGETHPRGTRLVDSQKCFRSQDIEEVGDNRHETFFEMLGNWSLGDYFKSEQISWMYEFLTSEIGLDKNNIWVSCFAGDELIAKDTEAENLWLKMGIPKSHILFYDEKKNWWSRAGIKSNMPVGEPGGPDSEIFYEFTDVKHDPKFGAQCHPNCDCGRFLEIGNNVFMTYQKTTAGFVLLAKKNIDFGGGLERIAAAANHNPDIFTTSLYSDIINAISDLTTQSYPKNLTNFRVISDHLKAATFLVSDGIIPGNKAQGYFLRRLIRRALVKLQQLGSSNPDLTPILKSVFSTYSTTPYFQNSSFADILSVITEEENKFTKTLSIGIKKIGVVSPFDLYQSYGFPVEVTEELYSQKGLSFSREEFDRALKAHQDLSRTAGKGMFKGGLQNSSEITTKYHTTTHLLHKALRDVLGDHIQQKGSNITADRLRFDFSHSGHLTIEQLNQVEEIVNQKISQNLPVTRQEMPKTQALSEGALAFFVEKYPDQVSVYTIGPLDDWYSKELCGGPHVNSTGEIGRIKIFKEESAGSGIRRIYAKALV